MRTAIATKTPEKQLRLTTIVTPKVKKIAERLAKDRCNGNVGELVRQLLQAEADRNNAAKKVAKVKVSTSTKKTTKSALVGGSHAAPGKPTRKRSAGNAATKSTKSSTAKGRVATKRGRKSTGTATKKR